MNREIKFRVWFDNKMHKAVDIDFAYQRINLLGADIIEFKNGKLMQYTGLKDKNGVEIYEGDILKIPEWLWEDEQEYCVCIYQQENEVCDIIRIWTICKRLIF